MKMSVAVEQITTSMAVADARKRSEADQTGVAAGHTVAAAVPGF